MYQSYRPLLDALVQCGADAADIEEAATESECTGRSIHDVLINDSIVTEFDLADAHGISSVDLIGYPIDAAAVAKIPLAMVLRHRVLGIAIHNDELVVATNDPDDVVALDDLRAATGMVIRPVVAARSELRKLIDRLKRQDIDLGAVGATVRAEDAASVSNLTSVEDDGPVVRCVNSLIEQAIESRASDLHPEPNETDMRVRFRIDGVPQEIHKVPSTDQSALISRLKIRSNVRTADANLTSSPDGQLRAVVRDDRGTTLVELMVGMMLMAIFGGMFTGAVVMMNSAMNKSQAVSLTTSQLNNAFLTLDKTVRYAAAISLPGKGTSRDWYVEFRSTNTGSEICTQLRITQPGNQPDSQQLQQRTWTVPLAVGAPAPPFMPLASGITNGGAPSGTSQPFLLIQNPVANNVVFQQLTINLAARQAGSGITQTSALTTVTFTALNSTSPVPVAICQLPTTVWRP